jgi:hypothetical protein
VVTLDRAGEHHLIGLTIEPPVPTRLVTFDVLAG